MALRAASVAAREAERDGLVDAVVPARDDLDPALRALARDVGRTAPAAVARWKRLCRSMNAGGYAAALARGAACTSDLLAAPQVRARIAAFAGTGALPAHDGGGR
jgi:enoyl-CoA hydratase/carnithine racemase